MSFVQGNVFFSNVITTIMARQIYDKNWFQLMQDLVIPTNKVGNYNENKIFGSLEVTEASAEHFRFYGLLQYALVNYQHASVLSIGLVKRQQPPPEFLNEFEQNQQSQFDFQDLRSVLFKRDGLQVVLTNPNFYTRLNAGDHVIVMGLNVLSKEDLTMKQFVRQRLLRSSTVAEQGARPESKTGNWHFPKKAPHRLAPLEDLTKSAVIPGTPNTQPDQKQPPKHAETQGLIHDLLGLRRQITRQDTQKGQLLLNILQRHYDENQVLIEQIRQSSLDMQSYIDGRQLRIVKSKDPNHIPRTQTPHEAK